MTNGDASRADERRLIIFARCPDPGRCKARLIPALGVELAITIYEALVQQTMSWMESPVDEGIAVEVHYIGDNLERLRFLCGEAAGQIKFAPQQGENLGRRIANAFDAAFQEGSSKVAIIGTDCPDLNLESVRAAFAKLAENDLVLGPANDGGYYLIALRKPARKLFQNIPWGGASVLQETLRKAQHLNMTFDLLPKLADIDRPEDLSLWTGRWAVTTLDQ